MTESLQKLSETLFSKKSIADLLNRCLEEDGLLDGGDVTSNSIIKEDMQCAFEIRARKSGVIAGLNFLERGLDSFGSLNLTTFVNDGDSVSAQTIASLHGNCREILAAERTLLNLLSYASGIATKTKQFVDAIKDTNCRICDTRKTTPSLRMIDKYSVACGGGTLHRLGLHDAALYKDNHFVASSNLRQSLQTAIARAHAIAKQPLKFVEIEVDSIAQLREVIDLPVDIILLDNMSIDQICESILIRHASGRNPVLEASGGITLNNVRSVAETGVDRIAVGSLTHQSQWLDIGLDIIDG